MLTNSPNEVIQIIDQAVENKLKMSFMKICVSAFLAGAYIAFGGLVAIIVAGGMPGFTEGNPGLQKFVLGALFPLGLMLVILAGAELFTGNIALFAPSFFAKKTSGKELLRNWIIVFIANFAGAIFVAFILTHLSALVAKEPWLSTVLDIGKGKVSITPFQVFLRGIGCNWLVCLSVWLAVAAKDTAGKILGIWFPIMAFVAIGFEHSIANMYFIPLAIFNGADISWMDFLVINLVPATIGNVIGGFFFVGTFYWFLNGELTKVEK